MNKLISHFFEKVPDEELYGTRVYSNGENVLRILYKSLLIAIPLALLLVVVSVIVAAILK